MKNSYDNFGRQMVFIGTNNIDRIVQSWRGKTNCRGLQIGNDVVLFDHTNDWADIEKLLKISNKPRFTVFKDYWTNEYRSTVLEWGDVKGYTSSVNDLINVVRNNLKDCKREWIKRIYNVADKKLEPGLTDLNRQQRERLKNHVLYHRFGL